MTGTPPPSYRLHHLALAPLVGGGAAGVVEQLAGMKPEELERFFRFVVYHGLAAHWYFEFKVQLEARAETAALVPRLKQEVLLMSQHYLLQKKKLREIDRLLAEAGISYLIEKGAHAREVLYSKAYVRPCADIDVLISKEDKLRVVSLFCKAGFSANPKEKTISNDLDLRSEGVHIDLHWDVLRPGRARDGLVRELLEHRVRFGDHFGPAADHTMFLMLVHPVFKKYVTTHLALLVRFLDMARWQVRHDLDWTRIGEMAEKYGLKTAAWLTGSYFKMMTGIAVGAGFLEDTGPGALKRTYLHWWIFHNLSEKLLRVPGAVKGLFTLPAHDSLTDALRFLNRKRKLDSELARDLREIQRLIEENSGIDSFSGV